MNSQPEHMALKLLRIKGEETFCPPKSGLVFLFIKGGRGTCAAQTATQNLAQGDILVINGSANSKLTPLGGKGELLFWTFSICFEHLLPLFSANEISLLHNITEGYQSPRVYGAGSPAAVECHRLLTLVPPHFNLDHRGQLIRIAASILSVEFKDVQSRRSGHDRAEDHMVQVFEKLSSSEIIDLPVGELAAKFSCSRRHLNRLFHQHFGVSVASLRMEMRLLKAVSLLRDPEIKIINVAGECGFNHLGLFNTCFKRRFGSSPGQWRKNAMVAETKVTEKQPQGAATKSCPLHVTGLCPWGGPLKTYQPGMTVPVLDAGGAATADGFKARAVK